MPLYICINIVASKLEGVFYNYHFSKQIAVKRLICKGEVNMKILGCLKLKFLPILVIYRLFQFASVLARLAQVDENLVKA